ncbi:hypothetical protein HDU76_007596 [Blyttiomyces sp. JEL0837]|nr:hypothetical protein HDU76_007596 [Blyttiomyces sp. JEL0837]
MSSESEPLLPHPVTASDGGERREEHPSGAASAPATSFQLPEFNQETLQRLVSQVPTHDVALRWYAALGLFTLGSILALVLVNPNKIPEPTLGDLLSVDGVLTHLKAFDAIAKEHGNRAAGYPGYNASVNYVVKTLSEEAGCEPIVSTFTLPVFKPDAPPKLSEVSPFPLDFSSDIAFAMATVSTDLVNTEVVFMDAPCRSESWLWFPKGAIAAWYANPADPECETLMTPGQYARAAGVGAVLVALKGGFMAAGSEELKQQEWTTAQFGEAVRTLIPTGDKNTLTLPEPEPIALLLVKTNILDLIQAQSLSGQKVLFNLKYTGTFDFEESYNVICDTLEGDEYNTIVIGSHLDGVPAGPGINDNASGSSGVLEIALTLYKSGYNRRLKNRIRFAWWGAEELGLLGSYDYLAKLKAENPEELRNIALAQNHDMLASPNGFPDIGAGKTAPESVRESSIIIEKVLQNIFNTTFPDNAYFTGTMGVGNSDFYPFLLNGIPAASLATGAGNIVTPEERDKFGVIANAAADPCYHQSCDGYLNIGQKLLEVMAKLAANSAQTFGEHENLREFIQYPRVEI